MMSLPLETWVRFFVWLGIGLVIYFLFSKKHSQLADPRGEPPAGPA